MIGAGGQERLSASSALIIGCGALGCQVSMLLAGAGVGRLGIVDFDDVSLSNLQRQVFFNEGDIGHYKSETLASRLLSLNSNVNVKAYVSRFSSETAEAILNDRYDFVIDATDTAQSKLTIEMECRRYRLPLCSGGVKGWSGQVITTLPQTASLSQIYPDMLHQEHPENLGVMGPTPAVIASIQASECIKFMTGEGDMLVNKILIINLLTNSYSVIDIPFES